MDLLDKNGIQYGRGSGNGKGFNFQTAREETFSIATGDILISAAQPKATMLKVLFEPLSKLVDSVTYDITAWSLPYVYGVTAYASKEKISTTSISGQSKPIQNNSADAYGYVIRWQGVSSAKTLAQLLKQGIKIRFAEMPFEISGLQFGHGSLIILKKGNEKFGNTLVVNCK